MTKLFNEKRIEDYFNQIERSIKNEIDNFSGHHLVTLDVNQTTEKLFERHKVLVPALEKEKTSSSITQDKISGYQFPSGTSFMPGVMYDIEIANYKVPFTGDSELFRCSPTVFTNRAIEAELTKNSIMFRLTNWGKITGDEKAIEDLKNLFLQYIFHVEENLNSIKNDVNRLNPVLQLKANQYLTDKIEHAKIKSDSNEKLNPFK